MYFLKRLSLVLPKTTSSVITDRNGSIKTNIKIVANPLIIADKLLAVVLNSGLKYPAYNADNTPIVIMATDTTFIIKTFQGKSEVISRLTMFLELGITMFSLIYVIPILVNP